MADEMQVIEKSLSINNKLPKQLEKAIDRNVVLRIGWTSAGDPVPKNGELGLCPNLPKGAKIRSLGKLGSFIACAGKGGTYTHQGEVGAYFGAGNDGNINTCERRAGDYLGFAMKSGKITVLDGAGTHVGSQMEGGVIMIRGDAGKAIGSGMKDGLIIVHGDVGSDPGTGMTGGKIVINGRCPSPPPDVQLRPLKPAELKEINALFSDEDQKVPSDAVCLTSAKKERSTPAKTSEGDYSTLILIGEEKPPLKFGTCDTITIIGEREGRGDALALPIPVLPYVASGVKSEVLHPCMVESKPRNIDIALIHSENLHEAGDLLAEAAGFAVDLDAFPQLEPEHIEGLLVALRSLCGIASPFMLIRGICNTQRLHLQAREVGSDAAISRIEDGSGIPIVASLPMIGRSASQNLEGNLCQKSAIIPWICDSRDVAIACASGLDFIISMPEEDLSSWLEKLEEGLNHHLRQLGLNAIEQLDRGNLRAISMNTASMSGIRLAGYDRPLPHWFAR